MAGLTRKEAIDEITSLRTEFAFEYVTRNVIREHQETNDHRKTMKVQHTVSFKSEFLSRWRKANKE